MPNASPQQTSQQKQPKSTLVFTGHDRGVVTELLERNGLVGTLEYREIPDSIINTGVFARLMALRVARYGHTIVVDERIHGVHVLEIAAAIPEEFRDNVIAITPRVAESLPVRTVHIPAPVPY